MNLDNLKQIIDSPYPDKVRRELILQEISMDKKAIPEIMEMLNIERERNNELILDQNVELSRALVVLMDDNLKYNKKIIADPKWVTGEIKKHYLKWKDFITCNFKVKGL